MYRLKDIIDTTPLKGRLIVGAAEDIVAAVLPCEKVLVAALEADYLFNGINIKNLLESKGIGVSALSLDDCSFSGFDGDCLTGFDCIVAVGERAIIDFARHFAADKRIVFVPTTLNFYYAFSPLITDTSDGLIKTEKAKLPDKVLFDAGIIKRLKLKHLADGFSVVASSAFWKFDYAVGCLVKGETDDASPFIDGALAALKGLQAKPYETIIKCQIFLAAAVYNAPDIDFCADRYTAHVLSAIKDLPYAECRFFAVGYIIKFYERALKKDISLNLIAPDYNKTIKELADVLKISENVVYDAYEPLPEDACYQGLKKAYESGAYEKAVETGRLIDNYKKVYDTIYKGRHRRVDVEKRTAVKAMTLAALSSNGLLRLFADNGITGLL